MIRLEKFSNGLTFLHKQTKNNPVSACHLFLRQGSAAERAEELGLTTLVWSLLLKGTKHRSSRKLAEDLESLGGHVGGGASADYSHVSCHAISEYFFQVLEIMGEVLHQPAFLEDHIEKEKAALVAAIRSKKENIFTVALEEFNQHFYGEHPYARPTTGTEPTVNALTAAHVARRHAEIINPNGAVLSLSSGHAFRDILPRIKKIFGPETWPKGKTPPPSLSMVKKIYKSVDIKRQDPFEQAFIIIGTFAPGLASKDTVPLKLLTNTLGGGMSSRLFQSLREQKGLAYDVGAFYPTRTKGSSFIVYMGLQFSRLEEAKKGIQEELDKIRSIKISIEELTQVKNFLKGSTILEHQTNSQRSYYLGWSYFQGRGLNYEKEFLKAVDRATPADIHRVAKTYLTGPAVTVEIHPKKSGPAA